MALIEWEGQTIDDTKVSVIEEVEPVTQLREGQELIPPFLYKITVDGTILSSNDYPSLTSCQSARNTFLSDLP